MSSLPDSTITDNIPTSLGALLLGGLFSTILSGGVSAQCMIYFNRFPEDKVPLKLLALVIWAMDLTQTCFNWGALWYYLILHFGNHSVINTTPWMIGLTTLLTSLITILVSEFYAYRIYILSNRKTDMPFLITLLCLARLAFVAVAVAGFIMYPSYTTFREHSGWSLTVGLSLLTATDLTVTATLIYLLYNSRTKTSGTIHRTINSLIQYTFKIGFINVSGALSTLICWLVMPHNLIFLTLFWTVAKLYANSFFAVLNARESLRRRQSQSSFTPVFQISTAPTTVANPDPDIGITSKSNSKTNLSPCPSLRPSLSVSSHPHSHREKGPRPHSLSKSSSYPQILMPRDSASSRLSSSNSGSPISFRSFSSSQTHLT